MPCSPGNDQPRPWCSTFTAVPPLNRPPTRSESASSSSTGSPRSARCSAAVNPARPAPITTIGFEGCKVIEIGVASPPASFHLAERNRGEVSLLARFIHRWRTATGDPVLHVQQAFKHFLAEIQVLDIVQRDLVSGSGLHQLPRTHLNVGQRQQCLPVALLVAQFTEGVGSFAVR